MSILKYFNPALFIILIVCFLLPFVRVSCGDEVLVDATGMDIVTGTDYSENKDKDKDEDNDDIGNNYRYIMIIVFGITVIGLILSVFPLIKGMNEVSKIFIVSMAVISVLSFILLVVYVYLTDRNLKETKNILDFKLMYGFFVLEAFYIITAALNILLLIVKDKKTVLSPQGPYYPPPVSSNKICVNCNTENISTAAFCKNCGNKL